MVDSWKSRGKLKYGDYSSLIDLDDWWNLESELKQLSKVFINSKTDSEVGEIVTLGLIIAHLKANLSFRLKFLDHMNKYDSTLKECLLRMLHVRGNDLRSYFLSEVKGITQNSLKDFDWSLKVLILLGHYFVLKVFLYVYSFNCQLSSSSDKQSKLNEIVCFVNFITENKSNLDTRDNFYLEMRKHDLDKFISDLDTIQNVSVTFWIFLNFKLYVK